jgi:hypothetical protein
MLGYSTLTPVATPCTARERIELYSLGYALFGSHPSLHPAPPPRQPANCTSERRLHDAPPRNIAVRYIRRLHDAPPRSESRTRIEPGRLQVKPPTRPGLVPTSWLRLDRERLQAATTRGPWRLGPWRSRPPVGAPALKPSGPHRDAVVWARREKKSRTSLQELRCWLRECTLRGIVRAGRPSRGAGRWLRSRVCQRLSLVAVTSLQPLNSLTFTRLAPLAGGCQRPGGCTTALPR